MSKSKTILITGTSNGFGNDAAKTLTAAGHKVFAAMREVHGRNGDVAKDLRSKGIEVVQLDVTSDESVEAAYSEVSKKTNAKLDVLINNAGVFAQDVSEAYTPEQLRNIFEVNVFGVQRLMRAVLPEMRKNKSGLIINVGSVVGRVTIPFIGLYGSSKFAVEAMTNSYRYEVSQLGIDVVLVQPSAHPTNLYQSYLRPQDQARIGEYGELGAIPEKLFQGLRKSFNGPQAPNPHLVAETYLNLIETPAGQRPARVVAGNAPLVVQANEAMKPIEAGLISALQLDGLKTLRI